MRLIMVEVVLHRRPKEAELTVLLIVRPRRFSMSSVVVVAGNPCSDTYCLPTRINDWGIYKEGFNGISVNIPFRQVGNLILFR